MTRHTIKSCNIFVVSFKVWVVVIFSGINVFFYGTSTAKAFVDCLREQRNSVFIKVLSDI